MLFLSVYALACLDVAYLNLPGRSDRRREVEGELQPLAACGATVARFPAFKVDGGEDVKLGGVGCTLSHAAVMAKYKNTGRPLLVVEDDFMWVGPPPTCKDVEQMCKFRTPFHVHLYAWNNGKLRSCNGTTCLISNAETASAYLVADHYKVALLHCFSYAATRLAAGGKWSEWANDQRWKRLQERDGWHASNPPIVKQRASFSSIEQKHVNYNY